MGVNGEEQAARFSFETFRFIQSMEETLSTYYVHCATRLCVHSFCPTLNQVRFTSLQIIDTNSFDNTQMFRVHWRKIRKTWLFNSLSPNESCYKRASLHMRNDASHYVCKENFPYQSKNHCALLQNCSSVTNNRRRRDTSDNEGTQVSDMATVTSIPIKIRLERGKNSN